VGARDQAVRGGARAERHELHLAACRVEDAELAAALRREPHWPPRRRIRPDVVRIVAPRDGVFLDADLSEGGRGERQQNDKQEIRGETRWHYLLLRATTE